MIRPPTILPFVVCHFVLRHFGEHWKILLKFPGLWSTGPYLSGKCCTCTTTVLHFGHSFLFQIHFLCCVCLFGDSHFTAFCISVCVFLPYTIPFYCHIFSLFTPELLWAVHSGFSAPPFRFCVPSTINFILRARQWPISCLTFSHRCPTFSPRLHSAGPLVDFLPPFGSVSSLSSSCSPLGMEPPGLFCISRCVHCTGPFRSIFPLSPLFLRSFSFSLPRSRLRLDDLTFSRVTLHLSVHRFHGAFHLHVIGRYTLPLVCVLLTHRHVFCTATLFLFCTVSGLGTLSIRFSHLRFCSSFSLGIWTLVLSLPALSARRFLTTALTGGYLFSFSFLTAHLHI